MSPAFARCGIACAGLMGAAGVALAAAAAHGGDPARLGPASSMLLFHAPAILALVALIESRVLRLWAGGLATGGIFLGTALFSGDLTVRHFAGHALFPMAAPIGGTVLIVSWLAVAVAGLSAPPLASHPFKMVAHRRAFASNREISQ